MTAFTVDPPRIHEPPESIEIKTLYGGDYRPVSADSARRYVRFLLDRATGLPQDNRAAYIESHHLRGITVDELMGERHDINGN